MGDDYGEGSDMAAARAVRESEAVLKKRRKAQKEGRLLAMAAAAARKVIQQSRVSEEKSKKRARDQRSLQGWLSTSRNADNRDLPLREKVAKTSNELIAAELLNLSGNVSIDTGVVAGTLDAGEEDGTLVLSSTPAVLQLSSNSSRCLYSEDDPSFQDPADLRGWSDVEFESLPNEDEVDEFEVNIEDLNAVKGPLKKKRKKNGPSYEVTRKFQTIWSCKYAWSEGIMHSDGLLHFVKCIVCSDVGGKVLMMGPKLHTISKYDVTIKHKANLLLYAAKQPTTVLQQINQCTTQESRKKRVQFATLFQTLSDGRPMREFESRIQLYKFLEVPSLPAMHWGEGSGWIMAEQMYDFVKTRFKEMIRAASFIALTCDETSAVDNTSWIAIHVYVMQNWTRKPLLLALQKLDSDGTTAENLLAVITTALEVKGGLDFAAIASKLICFGADGASSFQGKKNGVTIKLQEDWSPFMIGQHCGGHKLNLAMQALSKLFVVHATEDLLQLAASYFSHSPKKFSEYRVLAKTLGNKGLKLLKNVKTRWISIISPLRRVLAEYKSLIAQMNADKDDKKWGRKAKQLLAALLDPYALLGMVAMLPLLEAIDIVVKAAQKRDIYVCDFVAAIHDFGLAVFKLYQNPDTAYHGEPFMDFNQLAAANHEHIKLFWHTDLNHDLAQTLCFLVGDHVLPAIHEGDKLTRISYAELVRTIRNDVADAAQQLMDEVKSRFPAHHVMDALGVVYPQYWLNEEVALVSFRKHLDVLKSYYTEPRWIGKDPHKRLVSPILDGFKLESEQVLFKLSMIHNAAAACAPPPLGTDPKTWVNPLTKIWRTLDANTALARNFGEFVKLAEIAITHVLGSVEDERCFSSLSFLKDRLRNRLDNDHLNVVVGMHAQEVYILESFPYNDCFKQWVHSAERHRYGTLG